MTMEGKTMFKKNVGNADRILRAILGVILVLVYFMAGDLSAGLKWAALIVGVIMLLTAAMSSCPLYSVFGIKTCKNDE